jgi:hypothetical protein
MAAQDTPSLPTEVEHEQRRIIGIWARMLLADYHEY